MTLQFRDTSYTDGLHVPGMSVPHADIPHGFRTIRETGKHRKGPKPHIELSFPRGLLGYPEQQSFLLSPMTECQLPNAFLLSSRKDDGPRFIVVPPSSVGGELPEDETEWAERRLGIAAGDLRTLLIVTPSRCARGTRFFANRRAPLLLDWRRRIGWQRILMDEILPIRHPMAAE